VAIAGAGVADAAVRGWRVEMGIGNNPNETWSLFQTVGNTFWLTNYWSDEKPSGPRTLYVNDERFTFDGWTDHIEWTQDRRAAGRAVSQWMMDNCG